MCPGRQLFKEIVAGVVTQCALRGSVLQKLWQELSRSAVEMQCFKEIVAGLGTQWALRASGS